MPKYTDKIIRKFTEKGLPYNTVPDYVFKYKELDKGYKSTWGASGDAWDNKLRATFKHKEKLHRLDGPAIITWHKWKKGYTRLYYVEGSMLDPDKFLYLLQCPLEVLPLYITTPHYSEIVRHRLAGSKTEIEMKNPKLLTKILRHLKCPITSAGS